MKFYHPDKNINNPDYESDNFYEVYEAYDTLNDEERRKIYNKTQLILIKSNDMIRQPRSAEEWNESLESHYQKNKRTGRKAGCERTFL
ncbi:DnaJ domain-containing protein [Chryseobacterium balustinum]|uniref:DnaJ domain-containing protein n=1 Tax=Chryseobacterium balustinum TaxID=246 RepID=UPI002016BDCA|nr:DnaJ domain-containing protein [Chryseobacterium balustinum]